jgi:small-conductance mechanosensitive channel
MNLAFQPVHGLTFCLLSTALFGGDEERRQKVVEENERTRDLSNDQLMQEQKMMVQQQDRHLDDILVGVTRLKNIGEDINQELDVHSGLLNQLDKGVDNTTKAEAIQEESGGCLGLCIIFFLVGVILMLVATNWACYVFDKNKC